MSWNSQYAFKDEVCIVCKNKIEKDDLTEFNKETKEFRHNRCGQEIDEIESLKEESLRLFVAGKSEEAMDCYNKASNLELSFVYNDPKKKLDVDSDKKKQFRDALDEAMFPHKAKNLDYENFYPIYKKTYLSVAKAIFGEEMFARMNSNFTKPEKENEFQKKIANDYYVKWKKTETYLIRKDTPDKNRRYFRRALGKCLDYIYWFDRYHNNDSLEFLLSGYDPHKIKQIKLLTSIFSEQIDFKLKEQFEDIQNEMKKNGTDCEFRILTSKDLHEQTHERFIVGSNLGWNVPSVKQVKENQKEEITQTEHYQQHKEDFLKWWDDASALDLVKQWDEINSILDDKLIAKTYQRKCKECDTMITVPRNVVKQGKPVFCSVCFRRGNLN